MAKCDLFIDKLAAGQLSAADIDQLMTELRAAKKTLTAENNLDQIESEVLQRGMDLIDDLERVKLDRKRNMYRNIMIKRDLMAVIDEADKAIGKPGKGLMAVLGGINIPFKGAQKSIDALQNGIFKSVAGSFVSKLEKAGVLESFRNMKGDFELEVARALSELNGNAKAGSYTLEAKKIAEVMHEHQEYMLSRLNRKGASIRRKSGRVVRQSHDPRLMLKEGAAEWKAFIRDKLDFDKMGIEADRIDGFLDSAYNSIRTGIRKVRKADGTDEVDTTLDITDNLFQFTGPGNLAKRMSEHRLLEFKDVDSWFEYDQRFGKRSLGSAFMQELHGNAKNLALMDRLGTNPKAMLDKVVQEAKAKYRDQGKEDSFNERQINNLYKELSGDIDIIDANGEMLAAIGRNVRAIQSLAKLGGSVISAFSDIAATAASRHYQGQPLLKSWMDAFAAPMKGMSPGGAKDYSRMVGIGIDGLLGDFTARFDVVDDVNGATSKLMQTFFKVNLLQPWTDANKRAVGLMISNDLAMVSSKSFDGLSVDHQRLLRIYDIDAEKWDLIRSSSSKAADGNSYINPASIEIPTTGRFANMSDLAKQNYLDRVKDDISTLFINEGEIAVPTPGARERAIVRQGLNPGTPAGEAIRYIMQFKSFSVVIMTKVLGRQRYGYEGKFMESRGLVGLSSFIAGATVLGVVSYQAKQAVKGRDPRKLTDPDSFLNLDWKTITAGALQGGGLGIYGDFLFGEVNRYGGGFLQTAFGPGVGTAADVVDMVNKFRATAFDPDAEFKELGPGALNLVKSNIPFANLFYTKAALDYMVFYHMQEMMRPGYLRRMEQTLKREYDQDMWMPPSKHIKYGGGFQ